MPAELIVKPNTTLLRLVATHADAFYKQEWFFDHEFANVSAKSGKMQYHKEKVYSAIQYALFYIYDVQPICDDLSDYYVWTNDVDNNGDRVYVGMWGTTGFQIHRHLTINPKQFLNSIGGK